MDIRQIIGLIVFLAILILFFYGIYRAIVWSWTKRIPKLTDQRLISAHKETRKSIAIIYSVVSGLLLSPFFGFVWYFASKEMHKRYGQALIERGIEF